MLPLLTESTSEKTDPVDGALIVTEAESLR
jgi:hypothetical protein